MTERPKRAGSLLERGFWLFVFVLLAIMAWAQVTSALRETQTWDEGIHLAAGYSYLKTGDFRLNPQHPPLGKIINALPLLLLKPRLPLEDPAWRLPDEVHFGNLFLYTNSVPADTLLFTARTMTMLLTLLLGLALAVWTRKHFGAAAALFSLALFAFDPNITAHGRYVTTDLFATLFIFLSCLTWGAFVCSRRWTHLLAAGVTLGLALASKFTAVCLLALLPLLYLIRWWQERGQAAEGGRARLSAGHFVRSGALLVALGSLAAMSTYGRAKALPLTAIHRDAFAGRLLHRAARRWSVPAHPFLVGLANVAVHQAGGHESYLLGRFSQTGWWYYFPVVFAVKTPLAVLAAVLLCALLAAPLLRRARMLRGAPFPWFAAAVPMVFLFLASMASRLNLGVRHLLPVYPFLYVLLGAATLRFGRDRLNRWLPVVAALILAGLAVESLRAYPHYLAFFNAAAGGGAAGPRYLLDSNIDWGQDAKKLKAYMVAHQIPDVCVMYFGNADFPYYGIALRGLPGTDDEGGRKNLDCVAAISVTALYGLYVGRDTYRWLREMRPMEKIGYSIYLYDLRKKQR